ncbi:glycosyltransferase [Devosia naphthalenivorans]|uniref:glycosyltransferase n=1 Tax=Devosia naphthalenivorans TaxID=2082392 RepID=UPI000D39F0E9|nr:glycosyltransferase [Devosia naphthalenivorans]
MIPRRALVFTETALALSETFIAAHCRALQGYDYTLIALHSSGDNHADVPRHLIFPHGRPSAVSRLAFRLGLSRRIDDLIARIQPDIIHAHYLTNGAFLAPYAKRHGIPLVVTAHGHDATRVLRANSAYDQLYRLQRARLIRNAALILPVSNFLREQLLARGFPPTRTRTHYLGIPLTNDPPVDAGTNPPRIVFAGRLVAKKGINTVLEAFALVLRTNPDAELHIVGDGPLRPLVEARAIQTPRIIIHGAQSPERTQQIMASARLATLPSRPAQDGDVEGFGLVLIEAQALGVPVVTSKTGGTAEAVVNGETGFTVDPTSSAELAQAFLELIDNPARARSMGLTAHRFVRENFDIRRQSLALEQFYDKVIQTREAAA